MASITNAIPLAKEADTRVTAATLNGTGSPAVRAERVGDDTLLARIPRLVSEAQRSRCPIQRLADVIGSYFIPAVLTLAKLRDHKYQLAVVPVGLRGRANATAPIAVARIRR
ncbi:MAG: hypothetical protein ABI039_10445 [Vicinamibacterales bacterium]